MRGAADFFEKALGIARAGAFVVYRPLMRLVGGSHFASAVLAIAILPILAAEQPPPTLPKPMNAAEIELAML